MIPEYRTNDRVSYEDLPDEIKELAHMLYDMVAPCGDPAPTLKEFDYLMHRGINKFLFDKMGIKTDDAAAQ